MILKEISFYRYNLPLVHPLNMKGYLHYERQGLIIELSDENNNKGYGDAAPFSGLHQETINDIIQEGAEIAAQLYKIGVDSFSVKMDQIISPSLQFAFEWALLDLMARHRNMSPAFFLNQNSRPDIMINALLSGSEKEMLDYANNIKMQNPQVVKLKVAHRPVKDDILLVQKINDIFEGQVKLRLDANRSWSLQEAVQFSREIGNINIEFIEEPLKNPLEQQVFYENSGIRYALDESLSDCSIDDIKAMNGIAAFVIKPAVFGSINLIENWIDFARLLNVKVVFSSTFESSIGLWSIAQLASALGQDTAHGLDTYRWLKRDVLSPSFKANNFKINIQKDFNSFNLNREIIKPIII